MRWWTEHDKKLAKHKHTYLSCSLNRFLSKSGKNTSQSNSSMTSVRYTRSHHGCSSATWMQMMCERHPDQTDNTNEMQKKLYFIAYLVVSIWKATVQPWGQDPDVLKLLNADFFFFFFYGCIHVLQSAQLSQNASPHSMCWFLNTHIWQHLCWCLSIAYRCVITLRGFTQ